MNDVKILILAVCLFSCNVFSQTTGNRTVGITLPVVTLMDIEAAGNITMNFTTPTEATDRAFSQYLEVDQLHFCNNISRCDKKNYRVSKSGDTGS